MPPPWNYQLRTNPFVCTIRRGGRSGAKRPIYDTPGDNYAYFLCDLYAMCNYLLFFV